MPLFQHYHRTAIHIRGRFSKDRDIIDLLIFNIIRYGE